MIAITGTKPQLEAVQLAETDAISPRQRIWGILGASSGNLVEWFDFYVYSYLSLYFAHHFFPQGDSTSQLLKAASVFAMGFLMRPVGGWLFGIIADRYGRKRSMLISVFMMCGGSLIIACLPGYETIGVAAPVILLLARMLQGLSVGGEYGTSATYMSEIAPQGYKGFYGSFHYVTLIGGQLLAVLTVVIMQFLLDDSELKSWGWRVPFFIGALLSLVVLWLRRSLSESLDPNARANKNIFKELWKYRRAIMMVLGFTASGSLSFYTFTTYMQKYLVKTSGLAERTVSELMTAALLVFMLLQPLMGRLSDKIGRRHSMIIYSALIAVCTVPALTLLQTISTPWGAFVIVIMVLLIISFYTSISGLLKAEMFPPEVRALGVSLPYALANAIFGGSAEVVALRLKEQGVEEAFFWYVAVMGLLAFVISLMLPRKGSTTGLQTD